MSSKVLAVQVGEDVESAYSSGQESDLSPRKGTIPGTIANVMNTIIGAGILSLPYSMAQVGWASGLILFLVGAVLTQFGLHLLAKVAVKIGGDQLSFGYVAQRISWWLPFLADILVILITFTISVVYLGVAANFLLPAATYMSGGNNTDEWYMTRTFYLTLPWLILGVPLTFPKKVTILQYTSMVALVFILYTAIIVVVYAFKPVEELCEEFLEENNGTQCFGARCCLSNSTGSLCCIGETTAFKPGFQPFLKTFPVIITSFCCAPQLFNLYNDLINPTTRRVNIATGTGLFLCTLLYAMISFAGYFTYGDTISDDLLGSYPLTLEVTIVRLGIGFLVSVSYPLLMHPLRDSVIHSISLTCLMLKTDDITDPTTKRGRIVYYVVVVVLLGITYVIGLLNLNMATLITWGGALSVANLSFTLPGVYYWFLFKEEGFTKTRLAAPFMSVFGLFIMIVNMVIA